MKRLLLLSALLFSCNSPVDNTTPPPSKVIDPDTVVTTIVINDKPLSQSTIKTYKTYRVDTTFDNIRRFAVMEYYCTDTSATIPFFHITLNDTIGKQYFMTNGKNVISYGKNHLLWYMNEYEFQLLLSSDKNSNYPRGDYSVLGDGK